MNNKAKKINPGDRIFARVTQNGRTILNFMTDQVSNINELIAILIKKMTQFRGLVVLHIRNYHQGWGDEQPLFIKSNY